MKYFKSVLPLFICFFVVASSGFAQVQQPQSSQADSITDGELKKFAQVTTESRKIQMKMRKKVDSMLAEKDMDMQRFRMIMMSKRNPKMADSVKVTPKEQKMMKEIQPKLVKLSQQSQQKMVAVIKDKGLTPQQFQKIMQAVRTDPKVMKRFQKIAQDSMQSQ